MGLTSVVMVLILGQARIFFAMADDGVLPPLFARVHPLYRTPYVAVLVTGAVAAVLAGLLPVEVLSELVNLGTLCAFVVVCVGVVFLRRTRPLLRRPFKVPYSPYFPAAGALLSLAQIAAIPPDTLWRVLLWMLGGAAVYFFYSRHHAKPWEVRRDALLGHSQVVVGEGEQGEVGGLETMPTTEIKTKSKEEWG